MHELLDRKQQRDLRGCWWAVILRILLLPLVTVAGLAALLGGLAVLFGLPPLGFGWDFFAAATAALAGPMSIVWLACFLVGAVCFVAGPASPFLLQLCSLNSGVIARIAPAMAIGMPGPRSIFASSIGPLRGPFPLTRPSRTALSTASDLAGSTPRLE